MHTVERWLEITFVLLVLYLVLRNAPGFTSAVTSIGNIYVGAVKALQGR